MLDLIGSSHVWWHHGGFWPWPLIPLLWVLAFAVVAGFAWRRRNWTPVAAGPASREPAEPRPDLRVGDAERDDAAARLREHSAAGRLTDEELEERLTAVYSARTQSDLAQLLRDLPER